MPDPIIARAVRALIERGTIYRSQDDTPSMTVPENEVADNDYLSQVQTVLRAIREPSDAMLTAAAGLTEGEGGPTETWQAMIDQALAGE